MAFKNYHRVSFIITIVFVAFYGTLLAGIGDSEESEITIIINRVSYEQRLKVQLEENASTGYTWHYYSSEANAFSLFSKEISVDRSENAVQGGGSTVTWLFSPESLGSFAIIFKLYREWEGEEKAVDIRVFNVEVDDRTLSECIPDYVTVLGSSSGSASPGDLFSVTTEQDSSAGFSWSVRSDTEILRLMDDRYTDPSKSQSSPVDISNFPMATAEPGKRLFDFEALRRGVSLIELEFSSTVENDGTASTLYAGVSVK
ncbi:protease inhibitor I42 family protein [Mesotoga sp. BH458_6_3_2_1]|uniref:protease inhibitor I42 family protein n=1 Tax=Mesotoga sp. BH458_6_3_2_1 TaxID=1437446 RepID=UPI000EF1EE2E|nr:protease inhibitor I42 family protein [Mesotoga sp. BH458_6_3_2_1]RLL84203.1 hypothetical protein Y697_06285 [Mesotoga sp. BH458_6_3_2_1]